MRQKKRLNSVKKAKKTAHVPNRTKLIIGAISAAVIIIVGALIWWRIAANNSNKTIFTANVYTPDIATFTDNNTMFFATPTSVPEPNNARNISTPGNAVISYTPKSGNYVPAFKMNLTDAELAQNIKISPFVRGTWSMRGDNTIIFTPDITWPAETKFTIKINPDIFNDDVQPDTTRVSFTTPEITATVDNFNLYPAPDDKKSVIGIAVISFNYEIDTTDFDDKVSLKLDNENLGFAVKFDKFHRTAFIISNPVKITDTAQTVRLKLNRVPAMAGDCRTEKITAHTTIESADNIYKISSLETIIADNNDGNSNQLILLNTTVSASDKTNWSEYISAYLLPQYRDSDDEESAINHEWKNDEITDDVLNNSKKLELTNMDFESPNGVHQYGFSYNVSEHGPRYIYVSVKPGTKSSNDFIMKNGINSVMRVPYPAATVEIAGSGALLSLSGDRKLGIVARGGVDTAYINLYKIKSDEINHLISQTYDVFSSAMEFKSWSFGVYDMSVVFQKKISFANPSMTRASYASVDLGDYLDRTYGDNTGIFVIQTGTSENATDYNDKRLILLTDMGIIRKVNLDESSSVFVSNLSNGKPASDVEISVLGRNGNAVWAGRTDENGRANIPQLSWSEYRNAREPVAIVARRGNDVAFIPYNAYAQRVEYSKFDIDGTYSVASNPLNAFIFSDRGIYRPGESMVIGGIVKNKSFKSLAGIPVKFEMRDARGRLISEKTFSLNPDGMFDIKYEIPSDAPLGTWNAFVYSLNTRDLPQDTLGALNFDVQEFMPDTMKITANIAGATENGWISPENLSVNVSLRNLFGTPAVSRRIAANATLTPVQYSFPEYNGYIFTPNFTSNGEFAENTARRAQTFSVELPDATTDKNGTATIDVKFDTPVPSGTYVMTMNIRGFDANSGTSVQTNISTRVSDAKYLVGYHTSTDLSYINKNSTHKINIIALDHTATPTVANGLTLHLIRRENKTTLVKDYNNYYKYQTVSSDKIVSETRIDIPQNGTDIALDTKNSGTYFLQISDSSDRVLANIEYFVAGENTTLESDTNAELQIKLDKSEYAPGDEIAINITAPYIGTGLITIERDKVYAYKWFNTKSTTSVQHITVPSGFEGTGYINVSFVRDINSRDIFTTPYAYAVAPFASDTSAHNINIKLQTPEIITDNKLTVKYTSNKSARMMIFAINHGILQVAKYQIPNPLAHFFQKSALQVNTYQILSLLLPEYNILREYAKTGGGDYGGDAGALEQITNNPFARRTLPPVAFYSGIINAQANKPGTIEFDIPEYFNGEITIFAVAARDNAVGATDTKTLVQSPLIISTSAPTFVAPNDSFKINSVITNMTRDSGASANALVSMNATGGIEIANATATANIPFESEKLFTFDAHATDKLGNTEITTNARLTSSDDKTLAARNAINTLSVRPITPFTTNIKFGEIKSSETNVKDFLISMYPEFATNRIYITRGASAMVIPLYEYLSKYDLPCTEQLVSRAIPYALFPDDKILGTTFDKSAKKITDTINLLKNRQNDDGSFALWSTGITPENDANTAYLTAYVAQFLTIANDAGFTVPNQMLSRAIDYLRSFAGGTITDDAYAAAMAYAIYVISENNYVTTSYIDTFTQYANENIKNWQSKLMGAYIATSYKILKQDDLARDLIAKYKLSSNSKFEYRTMFDNNIANDSMYYYLTAKYFNTNDATKSDAIRKYINSGNYSAYTSASIIMAMSGQKSDTDKLPEISIALNKSDTKTITPENNSIIMDIPSDTSELNITCSDCNDDNILYYTIIQQGYPTKSTKYSNGIEIIREYYDMDGNKITSGNIGDIITVKIFARTRGNTDIADNVVITDMLPGGFIPTIDSINGNTDFSEMREDRILIYTDLNRTESEYTYTVQLGVAGTFNIPPISAQSMYNPQINALGKSGTFTVSDGAKK